MYECTGYCTCTVGMAAMGRGVRLSPKVIDGRSAGCKRCAVRGLGEVFVRCVGTSVRAKGVKGTASFVPYRRGAPLNRGRCEMTLTFTPSPASKGGLGSFRFCHRSDSRL